jgi:branched-chain amino acid transport system ATP-binding protein
VKERIETAFGLFPVLKHLRKRRAGLLSGGEQQMLAIGIALVAGPRLLLMDEPLLGLSPLLQADLARAVRDIREKGITVLVTEQFARPIMPIIDRGYVIERVARAGGDQRGTDGQPRSAFGLHGSLASR